MKKVYWNGYIINKYNTRRGYRHYPSTSILAQILHGDWWLLRLQMDNFHGI